MQYKNYFLDANLRAEENNSVYYKIILNRDNLVTIACLQDFDEYDYDQDRFFKADNSGLCVAFYSEENAKKYLNEVFKRDCIDPEYLGESNTDCNNLFRGMLKDE